MIDSPLRIVMLAPINAVGGIATWARTFQKYADPQLCRYEMIDTSVYYHVLGKRRNLRSALLGLLDATKRLTRLIQVVMKYKPHLVYLACAPSIGLVVRDSVYMYILRLFGVPTVVHLHGGDTKGFFGGNIFRKWIVRSALKSCRKIIVITREIEKLSQSIFGINRVTYLPNMIDDMVFQHQTERNIEPQQDGRPIRLLHVGRQTRAKGTLDLIEALQYVSQPISCELVGVAAEENRRIIENRIRDLGFAHCVQLVGEKTGQDLIDSFNYADIFVFPSHGEGFPMVILEAMAHGLPIIATDVGNISEMIGLTSDDTPCGLLLKRADSADPKELAYRIDKLTLDVTQRKTFSDNGRVRIRQYYLASNVVPEIEKFLLRSCSPDSAAGISADKLS